MPATANTRMNVFEFSIILGLASLLAGFLGALTGLGGGVVIVPRLALGFGVDIHYAIGASLVSVIATSSGSAAAYVREGFCNIRIGMFLEIATTIGAIFGAFLAAGTPTKSNRHNFWADVVGSARNVVSFAKGPQHQSSARQLPGKRLAPERFVSSGWCQDIVYGSSNSAWIWFDVRSRHLDFWASAPARSKCWRWTKRCSCPSKFLRRPATS